MATRVSKATVYCARVFILGNYDKLGVQKGHRCIASQEIISPG